MGDRYFDQLERSGHATRVEDLDLIAELGVRTVRYPILWERTAPNRPETADWAWADERLVRLRELGIDPIVGLVHHGSGPADTSLVDPDFPVRLAEYAQAVAERYPWLRRFTPVNEPLTTARFSGLYGHWYPHGRDSATFLRALLTQCQAVAMSMQAIRAVIPEAELIQTEDLGKTTSTPMLAYQADFENERRWLSLDLLHGTLGPDHPLWTLLRDNGIMETELTSFLDAPCPPDIIGINSYLTSERYLDENLDGYPAWSHGGNGRHQYADVHAVIARDAASIDQAGLLREVWQRYQRPMAITEAHLGGTREEQMRWLVEIWDAARGLRDEGVDLRAVTAWSLFGAYDWNMLVTRDDGFYEPGGFDLRSTQPRPTALARLLGQLAHGEEYDHPALVDIGHWRRPDRRMYPECAERPEHRPRGAPMLIVGSTGALGRAFTIACGERGLSHQVVGWREMDIANAQVVEETLDRIRPWAVVNAAGYVRVDDAEREQDVHVRTRTIGAAVLAAACASRGLPYVTFSSDLVFDGSKGAPYVEDDAVTPECGYGRWQADADRLVLAAHPEALVIRTSTFFSPWDDDNFVTNVLRDLTERKPVTVAEDVIVSPTYVPDLVDATLDFVIDAEHGLWHLANQGAVSWVDLAREAADLAGLPADLIEGRPAGSVGPGAPSRRYSVLGSDRGQILPSLDDALSRYVTGDGIGWQM